MSPTEWELVLRRNGQDHKTWVRLPDGKWWDADAQDWQDSPIYPAFAASSLGRKAEQVIAEDQP